MTLRAATDQPAPAAEAGSVAMIGPAGRFAAASSAWHFRHRGLAREAGECLMAPKSGFRGWAVARQAVAPAVAPSHDGRGRPCALSRRRRVAPAAQPML